MVYADGDGRVYDHPTLHALGRTAAQVTELEASEWIPLPAGATLVGLPGSRALGEDPAIGAVKALPEGMQAVGALLPQGFTRLYLPAFYKSDALAPFPLFGYTAVGFAKGQFYVAAHQTDEPAPWDPLQYNAHDTATRVREMTVSHPANRLYAHLATCALTYECVTSRNTFHGRLEGALPASSTCNAGCVGCISEQDADSGFPSPQTRMQIRPTVEEMAEVMVEHLRHAGVSGIISFGQGCEGEPATRGAEIAQAIARTREQIQTGYININTNAGLTKQIERIVDAGLDLMRVSTISALADHYNAYYKPRGYTLDHVERSSAYASEHGVIVSLNYLVFPGVTDQEKELTAMVGFIRRTGVKLVQVRNLNIDPDYYLKRIPEVTQEPLGMLQWMQALQALCPGVRIGSYTHTPDWYSDKALSAQTR